MDDGDECFRSPLDVSDVLNEFMILQDSYRALSRSHDKKQLIT